MKQFASQKGLIIRDLKKKNSDLKEALAIPKKPFVIGKVPPTEEGRGGCKNVWPYWMLTLIIETLYNKIKVTAITKNIVSHASMTHSEEVVVQDRPSESFILQLVQFFAGVSVMFYSFIC